MEMDKNMMNRIKRAEGQLRGIQRMMEEQSDCVDVITQLSAVRSSIDRAMGLIVAENLKECISNPSDNPEVQEKKMEQAIKLIIKK